jgi:hypothetical protein
MHIPPPGIPPNPYMLDMLDIPGIYIKDSIWEFISENPPNGIMPILPIFPIFPIPIYCIIILPIPMPPIILPIIDYMVLSILEKGSPNSPPPIKGIICCYCYG